VDHETLPARAEYPPGASRRRPPRRYLGVDELFLVVRRDGGRADLAPGVGRFVPTASRASGVDVSVHTVGAWRGPAPAASGSPAPSRRGAGGSLEGPWCFRLAPASGGPLANTAACRPGRASAPERRRIRPAPSWPSRSALRGQSPVADPGEMLPPCLRSRPMGSRGRSVGGPVAGCEAPGGAALRRQRIHPLLQGTENEYPAPATHVEGGVCKHSRASSEQRLRAGITAAVRHSAHKAARRAP